MDNMRKKECTNNIILGLKRMSIKRLAPYFRSLFNEHLH